MKNVLSHSNLKAMTFSESKRERKFVNNIVLFPIHFQKEASSWEKCNKLTTKKGKPRRRKEKANEKTSSANTKYFKGYCIRMPTEPELGITAPCKLWCTLVAAFMSCISDYKRRKQNSKIRTLKYEPQHKLR